MAIVTAVASDAPGLMLDASIPSSFLWNAFGGGVTVTGSHGA
jgi:hypothetical protein